MREKEITLEINGKEYKVTINEFGAYDTVVTVNGKKYKVGLKDLGIEQVSDIKPVPSQIQYEAMPSISQTTHRQIESKLHKPKSVVDASAIIAPLPGLILKIPVKIGDRIKPGQNVIIMEAMKMENEIQSNIEGGIKEIRCKEGDSVNEGDVLVVLE